MSDSGPVHNGLLGIAWGLGEMNAQNRFHGYVQAYIAQGMTLDQAQAAARKALGMPTVEQANRRHFRNWALVWAAICAFGLFCTVSLATAPASAGAGQSMAPMAWAFGIGTALAGLFSLICTLAMFNGTSN